MQLTPLSLIYLIAFSQAILLSFALWRPSSQNASEKTIVFLLLVMAYKLLEGAIMYAPVHKQLPHLMHWLPGTPLLMGPLFYGYICGLNKEKVFKKKQWLIHLLPAILLITINVPTLFISAEQKILGLAAFTNMMNTTSMPVNLTILLIVFDLSLTIYLWESWQIMTKYSDKVAQLRADVTVDIVNKQKKLCLALVTLEVLWLVLFFIQQTTGWIDWDIISQVWLLCMAIIIIAIGYLSMKKPRFFFDDFEEAFINTQKSTSELASVNTTEKSGKTGTKKQDFDHDTADCIAKAITDSLKKDKLYLDEKLSLRSLADHLKIKPHWVSHVINQHMHTNFYQLINSYRIQQVNGMIKSDCHWSLERMAYEAGFGNRVSFAKAFKAINGCTPSAYRKKIKTFTT